MRWPQKLQWPMLGWALLVLFVGGCAMGQGPRMVTVLGLPAETTATRLPSSDERWHDDHIVGFVALSDDNGPQLAPAISPAMLARLSQRTRLYLIERCGIRKIIDLPIDEGHTNYRLAPLLETAKSRGVESLAFALFSSTETTSPATFGEERMMTQMPGTTTQNFALVELGMIDVSGGVLSLYATGESSEALDRLTVPIGDDQPTLEEALDILRANAAQQALDKALIGFTRGCGTV